VHSRALKVMKGHFDDKGKFIADRRRNGDNVSNGLCGSRYRRAAGNSLRLTRGYWELVPK